MKGSDAEKLEKHAHEIARIARVTDKLNRRGRGKLLQHASDLLNLAGLMEDEDG